jgi:hypothetical protein
MPKASRKKSMHGRIEKSIFNFEIPGESMIAVHNALAFTLAHKEEYGEIIEVCDHCIEAMNAIRRNIETILSYSGANKISKKKSLN